MTERLVSDEAPQNSALALVPRSALAWVAAGVGFAVLAYHDLLLFEAERSLPAELEEWFFVPSQSIAPAVVGMSLWLLYRRLPRLRGLPARPGSLWRGAALLLAGLGVYAWATYTEASDLLVPALILHGAACLWLWKGGAAVWTARLPLALLVFAMPLPRPLFNELVFRCQIWTTELAGWMLYVAGLPHHVSGDRILRSDFTFTVIESCSGLRSMETLTLVAILMVDLFRRRGGHAWLVVLAAPLVAFVLNGARAVLLIVNPHSQIAAIHNLQGVAMLLTGLVLLFLLDELLGRFPRGARRPAQGSTRKREPGQAPPMWGRAGLAIGALAAAAAASFLLPHWEPEPGSGLDVAQEIGAGIGFSTEVEVDRTFLGSAGYGQVFARLFTRAGQSDQVLLFVGVGRRINRHRSPLSPKAAFPGSGWIVERETDVRLEPDGRWVRARILRSGSRRQLSYSWYEGAHGFPEEVLRAFLALDRSPWGDPGEIMAVRLAVPLRGPVDVSEPPAHENLMSFCIELRPLLSHVGAVLSRKRFS